VRPRPQFSAVNINISDQEPATENLRTPPKRIGTVDVGAIRLEATKLLQERNMPMRGDQRGAHRSENCILHFVDGNRTRLLLSCQLSGAEAEAAR
jgi:hypothetical protein